MGIFNDFKNMLNESKNRKIEQQKAEEDRIKREKTWEVTSDNIDNVIQLGAINVEEESYKIISRQNYENWYLLPALSKQIAVLLPIYLLKQMNSIYNDKPYDKIFYENRLNKFTSDWFSNDIDEVNKLAMVLDVKVPEMFNKSVEIRSNTCKLNDIYFRKLLYNCMAIDIINGSIPDVYGLCKDKYTKDYIRKSLNLFPIHGEASTVDGRSLNIAVAFYICYGVMVHKKFIAENINIENFYKLLIDKLGYTNIKMLSIEETAYYSGLSNNFFDKGYRFRLTDKIYSNKSALKFLNILKYLFINSDLYNDSVQVKISIYDAGYEDSYKNRFNTPHTVLRGPVSSSKLVLNNERNITYQFSKNGYFINKEQTH